MFRRSWVRFLSGTQFFCLSHARVKLVTSLFHISLPSLNFIHLSNHKFVVNIYSGSQGGPGGYNAGGGGADSTHNPDDGAGGGGGGGHFSGGGGGGAGTGCSVNDGGKGGNASTVVSKHVSMLVRFFIFLFTQK